MSASLGLIDNGPYRIAMGGGIALHAVEVFTPSIARSIVSSVPVT